MAEDSASVAAEEVSRIIKECLDTAVAQGTLQIYKSSEKLRSVLQQAPRPYRRNTQTTEWFFGSPYQ
ncbi:hypothetical protein Y032_0170g233 [Ancylostoma ceylanicum]|uniref:Uncharacterized protein n=1 Tax=Ancylostoma ceylanicum TaxID=53326 RepID=A0A016SVV6_9BILA|nr:hypothetical protein Y032_0170g233 [Ancylostoma ceylanicum]